MRYHVLAADYDGTLAHDGVVDDATLDALKRLRESGRKLIMVTGRELDELMEIFPRVELFDRVVAENGALLYTPETKEIRLLAEPYSHKLFEAMQARNVQPLSAGKVILATREPYQELTLELIRELGVEHHVIFNKGAVMVLPSGINKATGLKAALKELHLSRHNVVGVGDAENDHAFLSRCECSVAVANALPSLKERADLVTVGARGAGVTETIEKLLKDDLAEVAPRLIRHRILLGHREDNREEGIDPYGSNVLVCGSSGGGKSTITTGLLERLCEAGYQFCIFDPEGDYNGLDFCVELGDANRAPLVQEAMDLLREPGQNAAVNLLGIAMEHRPVFFHELLPRILELRGRTGRPHWLVIDEAHHLLPTAWEPTNHTLPSNMQGGVYITLNPATLSKLVLESINVVLAVGEKPHESIKSYCDAMSLPVPEMPPIERLPAGTIMLYRKGGTHAHIVHTKPPKAERKRHSRKYAEGNLGPDRSFYFKGREGKLNLKGHNLFIFLQMGDGVDDDTWEFHRERGDYSRWLGEVLKNPDMGREATAVEKDKSLSTQDARAAIRKIIESRFTLPADKPSGQIDEEAEKQKAIQREFTPV
jgi:HAD superfamily hydrolase (TIGR01484 family)